MSFTALFVFGSLCSCFHDIIDSLVCFCSLLRSQRCLLSCSEVPSSVDFPTSRLLSSLAGRLFVSFENSGLQCHEVSKGGGEKEKECLHSCRVSHDRKMLFCHYSWLKTSTDLLEIVLGLLLLSFFLFFFISLSLSLSLSDLSFSALSWPFASRGAQRAFCRLSSKSTRLPRNIPP